MAAQTPTDVDAPGAADTSTLHRTPSTYSGETVSADRPEKPVDDGTTPLDQLGDTPEEIHCPFCHQRTHTRIEVKKNIIKKVLCSGVWVVICVFCIWTPWAGRWFEEKWYFCSGCGNKVASFRQGAAAHIVYGPDGPVPPKPRFIAGQSGCNAPNYV